MRIGDLARLAGTNVETIRYYEREALLPEPGRSTGNYREYTVAHGERLTFIRHCRSLDMTLGEIRVLLRINDSPKENCGEVNRLLDDHISRVVQRIGELRELEVQLRSLRDTCGGEGDAAHCGILHGLTQAAANVSGEKNSPRREASANPSQA